MVLGLRTPAAHAAAAAVVILPVALPFAYLLYLKHAISKNTALSAGRRVPKSQGSASSYDPPVKEPSSLPEDVRSDSSQWIVVYERVASHPIPASRLTYPANEVESNTTQPSSLLTEYLRAAHVAFSWTPQALLIRSLIGDTHIRRSFDADWISGLSFKQGELVNGVYRVSHYESTANCERSELLIEVPSSYSGPPARGLLVATLEVVELAKEEPLNDNEVEANVVFVNETWMWRQKDDKPTLLEAAIGKWVHAIIAGWLVDKGLKAVSGIEQTKRQ